MKINKKYILVFCLFSLTVLTGCIKVPTKLEQQELFWCGDKSCENNINNSQEICDSNTGTYHQLCENNSDCPKNQGCQLTKCYIDNTETQIKACL